MKNLYAVLLLTTWLIGGCTSKPNPSPASAPAGQQQLKIQAYVVAPRSLSDNITVSGTLLPAEETELHAEISGRVVQLNIAEGNTVRKDALLVKLFDGDLQAQLKKLQVQLEIAQKTEERQRELLALSGSSKQDHDLALLQVNNLNADIEIIKTQIAKTEIRAPFDGKIGLKNISPGAYITPATNIARIQQLSQLKIDFNVPEKYGATLRTGQMVSFHVEGTKSDYTARIIATEAGVNEATRNLGVRAIVASGNAKELLPGAFAKVDIALGNNDKALMVPTQAIIPQARNKQVIVLRSGKAQFTTVTTGVRDKDYVEILSGVQPGDTLATTGIMFIKPNTAVAIDKIVQ